MVVAEAEEPSIMPHAAWHPANDEAPLMSNSASQIRMAPLYSYLVLNSVRNVRILSLSFGTSTARTVSYASLGYR